VINIFCPNCGTVLDAGSKFCGSCGGELNINIPDTANKVQSGAAATAQNAASYAGLGVAAQTAGMAVQSKVIATTITVSIVIAGIILYNMFFAAKPIDTVEKFFKAFNEKDFNTAITCMDPKYEKLYKATDNIVSSLAFGIRMSDIMDLVPFAFQFQGEANNDQTDFEFSIKKVLSQDINGDNAVITAIFEVENTDRSGRKSIDSGEDKIYLKKFNEGWRIVEIGQGAMAIK
jgi:limonene-1,2-epoxide hydrolase